MPDPFAAAAARLLARLGREAVLRGTEPIVAMLDHGVVVVGEYGELAAPRSVATLPSSAEVLALLGIVGNAAPRVADLLEVAGRAWILDGLIADDGYTARFYVREG